MFNEPFSLLCVCHWLPVEHFLYELDTFPDFQITNFGQSKRDIRSHCSVRSFRAPSFIWLVGLYFTEVSHCVTVHCHASSLFILHTFGHLVVLTPSATVFGWLFNAMVWPTYILMHRHLHAVLEVLSSLLPTLLISLWIIVLIVLELQRYFLIDKVMIICCLSFFKVLWCPYYRSAVQNK